MKYYISHQFYLNPSFFMHCTLPFIPDTNNDRTTQSVQAQQQLFWGPFELCHQRWDKCAVCCITEKVFQLIYKRERSQQNNRQFSPYKCCMSMCLRWGETVPLLNIHLHELVLFSASYTPQHDRHGAALGFRKAFKRFEKIDYSVFSLSLQLNSEEEGEALWIHERVSWCVV